MSLVSFIKLPDVAARLAPFRPSIRPIRTTPKVPRTCDNPALTGTAFDYLLRFELQRRVPHALHSDWVAEKVPEIICRPTDTPGVWMARDLLANRPDVPYISPFELYERITEVCRSAREMVALYGEEKSPRPTQVREVAAVAIRLAKIDGLYRAGDYDPTFEEASETLVDELLALLALVPFHLFVPHELVILNPDFGDASMLVGGADADLLADDMLLDIKTTQSSSIRPDTLDQLFGYFLLARRAGLPPIRRVGVYLSRYGHVRSGNTEFWTSRPDFLETEEWFFRRAEEEFGG